MKVLVVGGNGMLGSDVCAELSSRKIEFVAPTLEELDITEPDSVARLTEKGKIDVCINCAAYTAVDKAETESELAFAINYSGVATLAGWCGIAGTRLVHVSTDFVFGGEGDTPRTEEDETNPIGVYAKSKLAGEEAALHHGSVVVRTAWLYGPNGPSFPRTMIRAWLAGKTLRVVADQFGTPTYTGDLARTLVDIAENSAIQSGIYHAAGPDVMNWHQLAIMAIRTYAKEVQGEEIEPEIAAISTEEYPTPAKRPKYSALSCEKLKSLGIKPMRSTEETLRDFVKRLPKEV